DLQRRSPTYGYVTNTPKTGWAQFDLLGTLSRLLAVPMSIDTDVNAAALAEVRWGAGQHVQSLAYVTVGTGVGAGIVHDGRAVQGLIHPEMGHVMVRRHPDDHDFRGICPYHGDCLEGLACGPAIVARTGQTLERAPPMHPVWEIEADYLGQLAAVLVLSHSCERIVFGGGVMHNTALLGRLHERMLTWLGGYLPHPTLAHPDYICAPALGDRAGVMGALALALDS
ncbi:MAG: ROK family protein, partial [Sinobacteraceae bacterium]|nr:ROK family protein [Nevskiaceae bacterium]